MQIINLIADVASSIGMLFFLLAEMAQLKKIFRLKTVAGISWTTYKHKMTALVSTLIGFGLANLMLSFCVLFAELMVVSYIMKLMVKYK